MREPLSDVVVVGGDPVAPSIAAYVANAVRGSGIRVTLIDDMKAPVRVSSTLPVSTDFHNALRFNESSLVLGTGATFRLASEHTDWRKDESRFLLSFGEHGVPIRLVPFHQYIARDRLRGGSLQYDDFSLTSRAASASRFTLPSDNPASVRSTIRYGLHLDTARYSKAMLRYCETARVDFHNTAIVDASLDSDTGFVKSVTTEDGQTIDGDLFVDCSGPAARLIGDVLGVEQFSLAEDLPCDNVVVAGIDHTNDPDPVTRVIAREHGWSRRVQLTDRAVFEYYFNSSTSDPDIVATSLEKAVGGSLLQDPFVIPFEPGIRRNPWTKNCVAIGRAAGYSEPLEVSSVSLAHSAAMRLVSLLPDMDCNPLVAAEYNRLCMLEHENALDLSALFYARSNGWQSDFWNHVKTVNVPASLQQRLDLFASHGRLVKRDGEFFSDDHWVSALFGLGLWPGAYDPLADATDDAVVADHMTRMRIAVAETVDNMPTHNSYIGKLHSASHA